MALSVMVNGHGHVLWFFRDGKCLRLRLYTLNVIERGGAWAPHLDFGLWF